MPDTAANLIAARERASRAARERASRAASAVLAIADAHVYGYGKRPLTSEYADASCELLQSLGALQHCVDMAVADLSELDARLTALEAR